MKTTVRALIAAFPLALLAPSYASAATFFFGFSTGSGCTTGICQVANTILYLINNVAVPLLFAIAFIVFLWGVADAYILSNGEESAVKRGHKLILWGIIGFAVMVSLWGLVNVVATTFGLEGYGAPPIPQSPGTGY